ncbi:MAG: TatD family hydrolase [Chitinophagaceae bacterium]
MIIDTHCHLYLPEFSQDYQEVISRAMQEDVSRFYLPSIDSQSINSMLQLEDQFPGQCFSMMGLHPCSVKSNYQDELDVAQDWLLRRKFAAVGEIGLDFFWDKTFEKQQYEVFHQQIEWALEYDLPIVIHSRDSTLECIDVVQQHQKGALKGVFHCFGSDYESAVKIIDLGFYLGIGGILTYKNSGLAAVLQKIPLEHMVLETDAPYLTPVPFRGKRNESSYLKYVISKLALVKGVSSDEVAAITTFNAEKIFGS